MTKKRLFLALKFLLSGALIWLLFMNVDMDSAIRRVSEMAPEYLLLAFAMILFQMVLAVGRWKVALAALGEHLPVSRAFVLSYIGIFFNQTLPSSVGGDAVRVYKAYKGGLRLSSSINSVMLDRMATVLALVLVVAVCQPFLVTKMTDNPFQWVLPVLVVGALGGLLVLMLLDRLPESFSRWRVVRGLAYLASDTRRLFLNPKLSVAAIGVSTAGHVNISVVVYCLARGLGIDVSVLDCIVLFPPVILVTTLPISIAGWGIREGAMVGAFALVGVSAESALVLSILFGLTAAVSSLPGGILFLLEGGSAKELEEAEHAVEDSEEGGVDEAGAGEASVDRS